jgi:hypothetical protein
MGTDIRNLAGHFVSRVFVHMTHMSPELLIAVGSFDGFAREILLFRNTLDTVAVASK